MRMISNRKNKIPKLCLFVLLTSITQTVRAQAPVDLVIHYVQGAPSQNEIAYEVSVYLSANDGAGDPIRDLQPEVLTVTEDSKKIAIESLETADDLPIHIALAMDTSGSMGGAGIEGARSAAADFVGGLSGDDEVALISFNETVTQHIGFGTDQAAIREQIGTLEAMEAAGTCLYDGIYQAVQLTASVASGSRAVIVLTDGVDEKANGEVCSFHTVEDVIDLAGEGEARTPIFALGLGNRVDTSALKRISELTGGRHLFSAGSGEARDLFQRLADQLRAQYILRYKSHAGPGAHILAINLDHADGLDNDTRSFLLPDLDARVYLTNLSENQEVGGKVQITAEVIGQSDEIQRVAIFLNGSEIGSDETSPYEFAIDFDQLPQGAGEIAAIVFAEDGSQIAQGLVNVVIGADVSEPAVVSSQGVTLAVVLGFVLVAGVVTALMLSYNRKIKQERLSGPRTHGQSDAEADVSDHPVAKDSGFSSDTLGTLTVSVSDDPELVGLQFDILGKVTSLGRSATNDLFFPDDSQVALTHARIESKGDGLYLIHAAAPASSGGGEPIDFITALNDRKLSPAPVKLKNGDEIKLGPRVRLKIRLPVRKPGNEA